VRASHVVDSQIVICGAVAALGETSKVSGRPAFIRKRDLKQALAAALEAGAKQVQVHLASGASFVIPLVPDDKLVEANVNEWLEGDDADKA